MSLKLPIIDMHQDLLFYEDQKNTLPSVAQTSNELLMNSDVTCLFGSVFQFPRNQIRSKKRSLICEDLRRYGQNENWIVLKDYFDLSVTDKKFLLLHIEGVYESSADQIEDNLAKYYELGMRSLGLVWNQSNEFGGGCNDKDFGLTKAGELAISWCEDHNVIIDLAHMNRSTFWRVMEVTDCPLIVSHANCYALRRHRRNLTNKQIRAVADRGGVIGITFVPGFLSASRGVDYRNVANHIEHLRNVGGREVVAIGSDFGGIFGNPPSGLENTTKFSNLFDELTKRGWSDNDLQLLAVENAARIVIEFFLRSLVSQ